jgi:hypothetical protein
MSCECERAGLECGVRIYIGEPGQGRWVCQKDEQRKNELRKQAAITEYYSSTGTGPRNPPANR